MKLEGWDLKPVNHTSWVTVVTQTDRPKSVSNRCVINIFGGVFVLPVCYLEFPVRIGVFVVGLSQISVSLSLLYYRNQ